MFGSPSRKVTTATSTSSSSSSKNRNTLGTKGGISKSLKRIFSPSVDDEENRLQRSQFKTNNATNDDTTLMSSPMKTKNNSITNNIGIATKDTTPSRRLSKRNKTSDDSTTTNTSTPLVDVLSENNEGKPNKAVLPAAVTAHSNSTSATTVVTKPDPDGTILIDNSSSTASSKETSSSSTTTKMIDVDVSDSSSTAAKATTMKMVASSKNASNNSIQNEDNSSDCGTEVSSVSARREWLLQFGKEHETKGFRNIKSTTTTTPAYNTRPNTTVPMTGEVTDKKNVNSEEESRDDQCEGAQNRSDGSNSTALPQVLHQNGSNPGSKTVVRPGLPKPSTPDISKMPKASTNMRKCTPHFTVGATAGGVATTRRVVRNYSPKDLRLQKQQANRDVQATDEGYASVAKLSQWLASDPTSTKKKKQVRRGANVISKSRKFEKDQENVIIVENHISRGAVSDKKQWLQNAFRSEDGHDDDERRSEVSSSIASSRYTKSEVGIRRIAAPSFASTMETQSHAFRNNSPAEHGQRYSSAQSEIITDDAASSLSVADKKDWLKNAFKNNQKMAAPSSAGVPPRSYGYSKAQTDIVHDRLELGSGSAASVRAKMRFKERSARKLHSSPMKSPNPQPAVQEKNTNHKPPVESAQNDEEITDSKMAICLEDTTSVNFKAARESLIGRSMQNGQKVEAATKVQQQKNKLEKLEVKNRRKSDMNGPLKKPTWDCVQSSSRRPSTVYEKKYVPDIAPKKSFEDLP